MHLLWTTAYNIDEHREAIEDFEVHAANLKQEDYDPDLDGNPEQRGRIFYKHLESINALKKNRIKVVGFCDKDLKNAHSAEADTTATYEVLLSQIDKYEELENNVDFLADFSQKGGKFADMAGFIRFNKKYWELIQWLH